jgi:ribosomal protein S18 acetylase RimI-like enzyme
MIIDKSRISLKRATKSDIETIIEYRITFLKERHGNQALELESRLRQSLRQYFTKSLKDDSFVSWIVEYENKPIGFSGMVIREQPGSFEIPSGKTGYILNMFTLKEYRRNGIGSILFQKLMEEAKQKNLDKIELHATSDGEPIYKQFGLVKSHNKTLELILN